MTECSTNFDGNARKCSSRDISTVKNSLGFCKLKEITADKFICFDLVNGESGNYTNYLTNSMECDCISK